MNLCKSTMIYGISNALIPASAFLLLIVLTNFLTPAEYGMVTMFVILMGMGQACIGVNVHGAIGRRYFDRDEVDFAAYVTNGLGLILLSGLLFIILSFALNPWLTRVTLYSFPWLAIIFIICSCQMICWTMSALWVSMAKPIPYTLFQLYISAVTLTGVLGLVIYDEMTWEGRILGQGIAVCSAASIALYRLYRQKLIQFTIRKDYISHALSFGLPLIPHSIGIWLIAATDHLLIKSMISLDELGIYGVGNRIGMLIMLLQDAFNRAWMPQFYEKLKRGTQDDHLFILKVMNYFNFTILIVALLFGLFAPILLSYVLDPTYAASSKIVIWIALAYAFNGMYKCVALVFYYLHQTKTLAYITIASALSNIGISIVLVYFLGSKGAALGTMISFLMMFVLTRHFAIRQYPQLWAAKVK